MSIKKVVVTVFLQIFALLVCYAQSSIIQQANVLIQDDPNTTQAEGALVVSKSISIGSSCIATGDYSLSMGLLCKSLGLMSFSNGSSSEARANYSVAFGTESITTSDYSFAYGLRAKAIGGVSCVAFGRNVNATGVQSMAVGNTINVGGDHAYASGYGLINDIYRCYIIGSYNTSITGNKSVWSELDPIFIIGSGSGENSRKNALVVLKNGDTTIKGILKVNKASPGIPMGSFGRAQ